MDNKLDQQFLEEHNQDQEPLTLKDTFLQSFYLGCISFGGPVAHIGLFRQFFIQEKHLISEKKFTALFTLSNVLPGPTSSQLYTVISTIKSRSLLGGLLSFLGFNFPSLFIVLFVSSLIRYARGEDEIFSQYFDANFIYLMSAFSVGLAQGALAIVIQAGVTLGSRIADSYLQKTILLCSAVVYFIYNSYFNMIILMALGGTVTLLFVYIFEFREENKNVVAYNFGTDLPHIPYTGWNLIVCFLILLASLFTLSWIFNDNLTLYLMDRFFRIGSLIFGGGHVVIPMILSEFTRIKLVTELDVLNGFSLISLLPGPMFNIAGYVGTLINGFFSGLLSAVCIFAPGILLVLGTFPFLNVIKNMKNVQIFLKGVSSASIGFIFSAALTLWFESCYYNKYSNWLIGTINVSFCYTIIMMNYIAPVTIVFGASFLTVLTLLSKILD